MSISESSSYLRNSYYSRERDVFTFEEGIQYVLNNISMPLQEHQLINIDAEVIQNQVVNAISKNEPTFEDLCLSGSFSMDDIIDLPYDFNMCVKINLPFELEPIPLNTFPGFVCLRVVKHQRNFWHPIIDKNGHYINCNRLQNWIYKAISYSLHDLQRVWVSRRRSYRLSYKKLGAAHALVATETNSNIGRKISFDFLPVFEFKANDCSRWYAVPRNYVSKVDTGPILFKVYAPDSESNMQNLNDSLRLMKAFRNANAMPELHNIILKSIYLNKTLTTSNLLEQSPGKILIRMLHSLKKSLTTGNQTFGLVPEFNNLANLGEYTKYEYMKRVRRTLNLLLRRRNANYLSPSDLYFIFGVII